MVSDLCRLVKKKHFPLAAYNRAKKQKTQSLIENRLKLDESIISLQTQIRQRTDNLAELERELHKTEEKIRRRKRKVTILIVILSAISEQLFI